MPLSPDATIEPVTYPDPSEFDPASPNIPVRHRILRTPQQKTRDAAPPLQPTASRKKP